MRVEAFGLHHRTAGDGITANVGVLGGLLFRRHGLETSGRGKQPDGAIGEHSIHIKKQKFDFFSAGFRHCRLLNHEGGQKRRSCSLKGGTAETHSVKI